MVFKVSFKETESSPSKIVEKKGRTTTVVLKGLVELPTFWSQIPEDIMNWVSKQKNVELYEDISNNTLIVYSQYVAKCVEGDKYESLLGERLAEAHAKYYIYKFFYDLTTKLYDYYNMLLFGDESVAESGGSGSCLAKDIRKYEGLCIRESHHIGELLKSKENG
jgi:hypothetical protein